VSTETVVAYTEYFRDVALKIAYHDFEEIGGSNDIVEIDETHLFGKNTMLVGKLRGMQFGYLV